MPACESSTGLPGISVLNHPCSFQCAFQSLRPNALAPAPPQEDNEAMLAYFFLWGGKDAPEPMSKDALDDIVQQYVQKKMEKVRTPHAAPHRSARWPRRPQQRAASGSDPHFAP